MNTAPLNKLKKLKEHYFKLSENASVVYMINHYNREDKTYSISPCYDINKERFVKSTRLVYIGFTY